MARFFVVLAVALVCATSAVAVQQTVVTEHPSLCVRESGLPLLRKKANLKGIPASMWKDVLQTADSARATASRSTGKRDTLQRVQAATSGMRANAFAYLITEKQEYADYAVAVAMDIAKTKVWRDPTETDTVRTLAEKRFATGSVPRFNYVDSVTAEYTRNLALVYNWLYSKFTPDQRTLIRSALVEKGIRPTLEDATNGIWWAEQWHSRGASVMSAAGIGALSLLGEEPDAMKWVSAAKQWVGEYLKRQGKDGGCRDGFAGWSEGVGSTLIFMEALRTRIDDTDMYRQDYLRKTSAFALYGIMPDKKGVVNFGPTDYDSAAAVSYVVWRVAAQYGDAAAQWTAMQVRLAAGSSVPKPVWNFLWFRPEVKMKEPQGYPGSKLFGGINWAIMRTGWRQKYVLAAVHGGGQVGLLRDGDAGNVLLSAYGSPVLTTSSSRRLDTVGDGAFNCIYLDGSGPSGSAWTPPTESGEPVTGKIVKFENGRGYDYVMADVTPAYGDRANRVNRHVIFIKPDYLVVIDDIDVGKSETIEQRWHTTGDVTTKTGYAELANGAVRLRVEPVRSDAADDVSIVPETEHNGTRYVAVRTVAAAGRHIIATVLTPGFKTTRSYHPQVEPTDGGFTIRLKRNRWLDTITCKRAADMLDVSVEFKPALTIPKRVLRMQKEGVDSFRVGPTHAK